MNNGSQQIKFGAIISYGVVLFNIVAGLIYTPWMVSKIGISDYGLYILVTTFLAYFIVDYGMWLSINKLISQYRAEENCEKIRQIIGIATKLYVLWSAIVGAVLFFLYIAIGSIFQKLSPDDLTKFKTIFIIAAIFSVLNFPFGFVRGIMFANEYFIQSKLIELGKKIGVIACTVIVLLLGEGLYWLVFVYAIIPLFANILSVVYLYKKGVRMAWGYWSSEMAFSIIGISSWLFLFVLAELLINNISPAILASKSTLEEVAVFAIGSIIYSYVYQISNSVSGLFLSKITKMRHDNLNKEIINYSIIVSRLQLILNSFVIFGILTTGSIFIKAWMGDSFSDSYYVASILIMPCLISFGQQVEQSLLLASGQLKFRSVLMLLTASTSILLSLLLVSKYGAIGVAISISVSNIIFMVVGINIVYLKVLKIDVSIFLKIALKFVSLYVGVGIVVQLIQGYISEGELFPFNDWFKFLIIATIYVLVFAISTYVFLLNKSEKEDLRVIYNSIRNIIRI